MSLNPYKRLLAQTAAPAREYGVVSAIDGTGVIATTPAGAVVRLIGSATVGQAIYFRAGVIEGPAKAVSEFVEQDE